MSTVRLKEQPAIYDQMLRTERLIFECAIVANATPANKRFSAEVPVAMLRAQGLTAAVDAVEALTWTSAVDNNLGNSVFGLYLNIGRTIVPAGPGPVPTYQNYADRIYKVEVIDLAGNTIAVTGPNAAPFAYLTPLGNVAIEIAATALNLSTTNAALTVIIDYREANN